ncbi:Methylenetetrahydrofolate reductase [Arenibacter palladensis]|uniref:Methylenetetrahydrofolate reductase n=1 Tax=Arenibacter palladensis TaxID=237373 RepID=A0A1M4VJD0_9FLAO|nr:methylenetetrahydrofolate reductase [Arenibacter palladensis]SHE68952.1 Methylenetetrahydrofolate reductase [Arenibacter palladensis]
MLKDRIINKESGFLFYGLTPPKINTEEDKVGIIADKQVKRLRGLKIDGLVLYDIQDESSRTDSPRPFPFMPTLAPNYYSDKYLSDLKVPKIIYKSVGKYTADEFRSWIYQNSHNIDCSVFVGSPSKNQVSGISLNEAYKINQHSNSSILLGGVAIPERHIKKGDEHIRLFDKVDKGCSFFISQCVYSVNNTKDFLSDYYYTSIETERDLVPIIFTLTPCGSLKTLQFMEWLGIDIPKWLNNDLKHSNDILSKSIDLCKNIAIEILDYSVTKNLPIGFNIESVAIRKEEIEASIELLKDIKGLMNR